MVQFTVRVNYQGKLYQTNVLAHREDAEDEIYNRAFEQVQRQWKEQKEAGPKKDACFFLFLIKFIMLKK